MEMNLYCIYDYKAQGPVGNLFQCWSTDAQAARSFEQVVMSPGHLVNQHPGDFGLVCVGVINFDSLQLVANPACVSSPIIMGDACVRAVERARVQLVPSDGDKAVAV